MPLITPTPGGTATIGEVSSVVDDLNAIAIQMQAQKDALDAFMRKVMTDRDAADAASHTALTPLERQVFADWGAQLGGYVTLGTNAGPIYDAWQREDKEAKALDVVKANAGLVARDYTTLIAVVTSQKAALAQANTTIAGLQGQIVQLQAQLAACHAGGGGGGAIEPAPAPAASSSSAAPYIVGLLAVAGIGAAWWWAANKKGARG